MKNFNNQKEEDSMRDILKDKSNEQVFGICKATLLDAYNHGIDAPNPHNLEVAYLYKRELERRRVDSSILEELEKMELELRKEYGK